MLPTDVKHDSGHMARAFALAERALCDTDPNPAVGCVIAIDAQIVGEGWTAPVGGPHAERTALAAAGEQAKGATAYVTFEPCGHVGRTGPCTRALIEAGVQRVVYSIDDPNPAVAGQGAAELRAAGIVVESGLGAEEARDLNRGFLSRMARGRPWVRLKIAASLDGRTALANGVSQWITQAEARNDVHRWRARSSAILTGIGTVLRDDPSLDARGVKEWESVQQPVRVVLDSHLRTPRAAKLLTRAGSSGIFTCCESTSDDTDEFGEATWVCQVPSDSDGRCDLHAVMRELAAREINDVWVEAGGRLNGALLDAGLIDELLVYTAPMILGTASRGMFDIAELKRMGECARFEITDVKMFGPDLRLRFRPSTVARPKD